MADAIQVCNKENGCFSTLFGRDCWIADSLLSLVESHVDTLHEQTTNAEVDKALKSVLAYCEELRAKNKEHWPDELLPDLSVPERS